MDKILKTSYAKCWDAITTCCRDIGCHFSGSSWKLLERTVVAGKRPLGSQATKLLCCTRKQLQVGASLFSHPNRQKLAGKARNHFKAGGSCGNYDCDKRPLRRPPNGDKIKATWRIFHLGGILDWRRTRYKLFSETFKAWSAGAKARAKAEAKAKAKTEAPFKFNELARHKVNKLASFSLSSLIDLFFQRRLLEKYGAAMKVSPYKRTQEMANSDQVLDIKCRNICRVWIWNLNENEKRVMSRLRGEVNKQVWRLNRLFLTTLSNLSTKTG